jgi:hypothetical protein
MIELMVRSRNPRDVAAAEPMAPASTSPVAGASALRNFFFFLEELRTYGNDVLIFCMQRFCDGSNAWSEYRPIYMRVSEQRFRVVEMALVGTLCVSHKPSALTLKGTEIG